LTSLVNEEVEKLKDKDEGICYQLLAR